MEDLNDAIDFWISELPRYKTDKLVTKPTPDSWSIGQLCMHLVENTDWFIEQAKTCLANNDHTIEEATPAGKAMLLNNDFPDDALEGPPENAHTPQPDSLEQLTNDLLGLKNRVNDIEKLISTTSGKGKTKHPGLGYFDAHEWLQFAEMHLRHHQRQKKRIDKFLNIPRQT